MIEWTHTNEKGLERVEEKKKNGFKTVETNYEELEEQLKVHKKQVLKRGIKIAVAVVVFVLAVELISALRRFDSYEIQNMIERSNSSVTQYTSFDDCLLEYSNDGISCIKSGNDIIWNQSFEMISPKTERCGDYVAVYDAGGTEIYILTKSGVKKEIEMSSPIQTVCIARQGTIAVLMKEDGKAQVKLLDVKGNELANGIFYDNQGVFPIDIALSYDATKLAVDMVDINGGQVATVITFYNFGSVGQSEIDNIVGTYTFEGILIPEIHYISDSKMFGMGTGKMLVFDGAQKPEVSQEIIVEEEIVSCFYNEKYVGIVYDNIEEENSCHLKVMDMYGRTVMENDISMIYDPVEFLSNDEVCVRNSTACEIFTMHSIKKFSYTFDKELYKILSGGNTQNYTFIFKDTIEEVRLK